MSAFEIKGWCPSALRPMLSGDGLVVRLRPRGGRLSSMQAAGIAGLSQRFGNGLIDLTNRANLQIRGVREESHEPLIEGLNRLELVNAELYAETQRNILVSPFWNEGDDIPLLAAELERALARHALGLPEKFGFAVDCRESRVLAQAPADIRIERGTDGSLIVRADGVPLGRSVARGEAVDAVLSLCQWFVASGGVKGGRGRMAAHLLTATPPDVLAGRTEAVSIAASPGPGIYAGGALVGLASGQLQSAALMHLATLAPGLRMTPWRMIFLEGVRETPAHDGLVTRADDPLLRVIACTGAPACPEAQAETRTLAATLAPHVPEDATLHVSGCAKGCAHLGPSALTLVGTADGYDLVRHGSPRDAAEMHGLTRAQLLANPRVLTGAR